MRNEPAITVGTISALIGACLVLAKSFGVPISVDQESAIKDFALVALPIIAALIVRSRVTPTAKLP